jgi:WD40 repeat protein
VLALVVILGLAVSNSLIRQQQDQTNKANRELALNLYFQTIALAEREHAAGNLGLAERLLGSEGCPEHLRGWEWHYLKGLCRSSTLVFESDSHLWSLALSPDERWLATGDSAGGFTLRDTQNWNRKWVQADSQSVRSLAFLGNGHLLAAAWHGQVRRWDLTSGTPVAEGRVAGGGQGHFALSPDSRLLATAEESQPVVWEVKDGPHAGGLGFVDPELSRRRPGRSQGP